MNKGIFGLSEQEEKNLHYLQVLKGAYFIFQKEIRNAIDYAIETIENKQ